MSGVQPVLPAAALITNTINAAIRRPHKCDQDNICNEEMEKKVTRQTIKKPAPALMPKMPGRSERVRVSACMSAPAIR
ncbi:hypothetical protein CA592_14935 (plasmid) [Anoxybacillus flavithermus]|nr:hypothetical protein CA592_14935 [Anoxybacillus flavithermus]